MTVRIRQKLTDFDLDTYTRRRSRSSVRSATKDSAKQERSAYTWLPTKRLQRSRKFRNDEAVAFLFCVQIFRLSVNKYKFIQKRNMRKTRAKARLWNVVFLDKTSLFSDDSIIKIQIISGEVNALQCFKIDNFYEDEIFYPNINI